MDRLDCGIRSQAACLLFVLACALGVCACQRAGKSESAAGPGTAAGAPRSVDGRPFPRQYSVDGKEYVVHQPQLDSWDGRTLKGRFALSVKTGSRTLPDGKQQEMRDFGVVWFATTTRIDAAARTVVLTDVRFERASFPNAIAREAEYLQASRSIPGRGAIWTMSLDQLESGLAVSGVRSISRKVASDPPEIIFSTGPAILLMVDGKPVLRPAGQGIDRVLNTRSLLLRSGNDFYTRVAGHWASAPALMGPWQWLDGVDARLASAASSVGAKVETFEKPIDALARAFSEGAGPRLFVRTQPAELISVQGEPVFDAIPGTALAYIVNTGADVFIDGGRDNAWYVLVSGRWFSAPSSKGPWSHVARGRLPPDFSRIPPAHEKSGVLASIAGTPESREALIANSIPQTAAVQRASTRLQVPYDGEPFFAPIEGTRLQYARNSPVPVIHVLGSGYFAVDKGVWFYAKAPVGPWSVADDVPAEIYAIPTNSPLHYVTYVRVYGSQPEEVYVGYTPGYYGTVVSDDVVVYGTGYEECDPWVGSDDWYGCPATYGMGTYFGWNPWVGWTFGWGWGWNDGWYGPYDPWWGPWWGGRHDFGSWDGGAVAWNVYERWGGTSVRGTAAAWLDTKSGNAGRAFRGAGFNPATGVVGAGRAAINRDLDTGHATLAAQGIRYDADTGRVTGHARIAAVGPEGAAAIGAARSEGPRIDAAAVGGVRFDADDGSLHRGGVANVNDNIYASRDGEVYRYRDGEWSKVDVPRDARRTTPIDTGAPGRGIGAPKLGAGVGEPVTQPGISQPGVGAPGYGAGVGAPGYGPGVGAPDLNQQRYARERGYQRSNGGGQGYGASAPAQRPSGGASRPVGGYRPSLGGGGRGRR